MKGSLLFIIFFNISLCACAQNKEKLSCVNAQTQLEMNRCAAQKYREADEFLNKVYKEVISKLNPAQKELMVKAQRSWLVVRDSHCGLYEQFYQGGSIMPLMLYTCKTELTETRTRQLRSILEEVTGK